MDDGSFAVTDSPSFELSKSTFYRQEVSSRDLHVQLPGEMAPAKLAPGAGSKVVARLPWQVPVWDGMRGAVIDLNGGSLRVAGGLAFRF